MKLASLSRCVDKQESIDMIAGRCPNIKNCSERIDYINLKKFPSECKNCKQAIRRMHLEEYMNNMEAITELVNRMKTVGKTCKLI